jgi:hypothetical protein
MAGAMRARSSPPGSAAAIGRPPGENRQLAVALDAHGHFRADQADALGAQAAGQQTPARDADFRLRRTCHHGAVCVAHDDIAQPQRGSAIVVALQHGAADLNAIAPAKPFLQRGAKPRRGQIEGQRSAAKPPPQCPAGDPDDGGGQPQADEIWAHTPHPAAGQEVQQLGLAVTPGSSNPQRERTRLEMQPGPGVPQRHKGVLGG